MKTLIVKVMTEQQAREKMKESFISAMSEKQAAEACVQSFSSIEQLAKVMLAPNRLAIINTMAGANSMSVRELARRVSRDFRAVHRDVQALLAAELLEHDEQGKIIFPYDAVKFDFMIEHKTA